MDVIITGIVGIITSITSSWITWFVTRKKYNSEVDANLIHNMQASLEFYQKLSDDNKVRLDRALQRSADLEGEVKELRIQVMKLMSMVCTDLTCKLRKAEQTIEANTEKSENISR